MHQEASRGCCERQQGCGRTKKEGVAGVAPLLELARRQRQLAVQHGVEHGDKGHVRDHRPEEVGPQVHARADQHASRRPAADGDVALARVAVLGQLVGARDEVEEGALLAEELGRLVPRLAKVAASPDVRGGHDEA